MRGGLRNRARVFDHVIPFMNPHATIFGSTVLGRGVPGKTWLADKLMALYNRKGIFCNDNDVLEDLKTELDARFGDVRIEMRGLVAIFSAKVA